MEYKIEIAKVIKKKRARIDLYQNKGWIYEEG